MENKRLLQAMMAAHVGIEEITAVTNVDPKTVQRWLKGRVPHARHRWKVAELLKERDDYLWPPENVETSTVHTSEILAAYAHRSDVPPSAWWHLFQQAQQQIDLLGYAMQFLPEQHAHFIDLLKEKAAKGCKIRVTLADPTCYAVQLRDEEEQLGGTLPARIQATLHHFRSFRHCNGIEIRYHSTNLYNSIFRSDNTMFVTPHLYGLHGSKAPLLYLRSLNSDGLFANFAAHFEAVWATAKQLEKD